MCSCSIDVQHESSESVIAVEKSKSVIDRHSDWQIAVPSTHGAHPLKDNISVEILWPSQIDYLIPLNFNIKHISGYVTDIGIKDKYLQCDVVLYSIAILTLVLRWRAAVISLSVIHT